MVDCFRFYVDDSGSRHPDRNPAEVPPQHDWFALGGVLIAESKLPAAEAAIESFRARWPEMGNAPLHSAPIRSRNGDFRWLMRASASRKDEFMCDLTRLMTSLPIVVHACVVDRPGYNNRYKERYGRERWALCRTAFTIAVERAAKYARAKELRLRVYVEQSDRKTEGRLKGYYEALRTNGTPFSTDTSAKYGPMAAEELSQALLEFRVKSKASTLMQIADLALWPACKGGYAPENLAFTALRDAGKLIDTHCTADNGVQGIKYSCFDLVHESLKRQEPAEAGSWAATKQPGGDLVG
jgi:hypothetical protein